MLLIKTLKGVLYFKDYRYTLNEKGEFINVFEIYKIGVKIKLKRYTFYYREIISISENGREIFLWNLVNVINASIKVALRVKVWSIALRESNY